VKRQWANINKYVVPAHKTEENLISQLVPIVWNYVYISTRLLTNHFMLKMESIGFSQTTANHHNTMPSPKNGNKISYVLPLEPKHLFSYLVISMITKPNHLHHTLTTTHQKKRPIFCVPSNTKIPVGVRPSEYSHPSLP